MADNFETLWIQTSLNRQARTRAAEAIEAIGKPLPSSVVAINGSLIQVKFEITGPGPWATLPLLWLPKAESQWLRAPVQVGDVGMVIPAATFLGGISGQGSGVANMGTDYGNLSTLVWVPVAAVSFGAPPDADKAWINGPAGSVVSDTAQTAATTHSRNKIEHAAAPGTTSAVSGVFDGAANAITHEVTNAAGRIYTLLDGAGKAISLVPTGGKVGLGALASSLADDRAAAAQADLQTLANNIVAQTIQNFSAALGTAAASTLTGGASFAAIISASGFVTGISGINPTIPTASSIVRLAP